VLYESGYDHDQAGLISFVDENKEQFVFTDFEPYFANRVFPCFDQPNLKARMTLTVITENPWIALSHDKPTSIQSIQ
jgi:aminopeptidase N